MTAETARFNVFDLSHSFVKGDVKKITRILKMLQLEGEEPPIVLWALTRELRTLVQLSFLKNDRQAQDKILFTATRLEKHRQLLKQAFMKRSYPQWCKLLQSAATVDKIIKGMEKGAAWDALHRLSLAMI